MEEIIKQKEEPPKSLVDEMIRELFFWAAETLAQAEKLYTMTTYVSCAERRVEEELLPLNIKTPPKLFCVGGTSPLATDLETLKNSIKEIRKKLIEITCNLEI